MDEHHLIEASEQQQQQEQEPILQNEEEQLDSPTLSQLCSSCCYEKATVICTVCNESGSIDTFASTQNIAKETNKEAASTDEIYFQKNAVKVEDDTDNDELKFDLDLLMRSTFVSSYVQSLWKN